jgi:hypothetical protein
VLSGPTPLTVTARPGPHELVFSKEGYTSFRQSTRVGAGTIERVRVHLEASPATGFELTSDPAGQLVWLDGQPFTGADPNGPQARTDLRASRVPPGRHLLEIKGDRRLAPWRQEFFQEPSRMMHIRASLAPAAP